MRDHRQNRQADQQDDLWVFGYGSLMWNPGFAFVEKRPGRMAGVHRAPCIFSWVHRGTQESPGIVLGLAAGGSCQGMFFRVEAANSEAVIDYLRERELVTHVYLERMRRGVLDTGEAVTALTYIADRHHRQYAGKLSVDQLVRQISGAVGKSGDNESYILDTVDMMLAAGIRDSLMEQVAARLRSK